jgi:hypothetical protein
MKSDYSEKEFAMIQICSPHWAKLISDERVDFCPPTVLECVMKEVFIENKTGPAVESLRRCLKSFYNGKIYRMTPEYDALIQID